MTWCVTCHGNGIAGTVLCHDCLGRGFLVEVPTVEVEAVEAFDPASINIGDGLETQRAGLLPPTPKVRES